LSYLSFSTLLLVMPRPPPSSTLFPYTTLFRSLRAARLHPVQRRAMRPLAGEDPLPGRACLVYQGIPARPDRTDDADVLHPILPADRKSTRLNSSHVKISYAVFCLKKKKEHKMS